MRPTEGEAWGLQQAMMWMEMLGYHKVILRWIARWWLMMYTTKNKIILSMVHLLMIVEPYSQIIAIT
jgi:hypothetical protein